MHSRAFRSLLSIRKVVDAQYVSCLEARSTLVVRTAQPLGTLAALLLEPQSEDGLCTWNFFDSGLAEGQDFPVLRLPRRVSLDTLRR